MLIYQVVRVVKGIPTKEFETKTFEECLGYLTDKLNIPTERIAIDILSGYSVYNYEQFD